MNIQEFSDTFDVLYNNICSNAAPGLNEYEKSVFLTKAQDEIVKNYFNAKSKGNNPQQGYDDSAKRQADFSALMYTQNCGKVSGFQKINKNSSLYRLPADLFIPINETVETEDGKILQVIPLRYDEYTRLMSKPFKRPLKNQVWRIMSSGSGETKIVELIANAHDTISSYIIRYIRQLKPIVLTYLDGLTINGVSDAQECELDSMLHEEVLQRAVELAKAAWVASNSNDNIQVVAQLGQRSE